MKFLSSREFLELRFRAFLEGSFLNSDAGHDALHISRVCKNAEKLALTEKADLNIVLPAAWLHDCVSVPKNAPLRKKASVLAGETAIQFLSELGYAPELLPAIRHAIEAHSFSAGITPETIEAKIVQDADRLDALGAIGIARCFLTGATFQTPLYSENDPFCSKRKPDESRFILDHFYQKLLLLAAQMQTDAGRKEAEARTLFMMEFIEQLSAEITSGFDQE